MKGGHIMPQKIVTFGELMMRLSPEGYYRFIQADRLCTTYGGAEANVAVLLAEFGCNSCFVTKLPEHEIGQCAVNYLRRFGVDTSYVVRGGSRVGIYFLEKGISQRPSKVIYDRSRSSLAEAETSDFKWDKIFKNADWFHFTGITPALSDNAAEICLEACKYAKEKKITISCDLNYRGKLWTKESAQEAMSRLCKYVDLCIANEEDAENIFGIKSADTDVSTGKINREGYADIAEQLTEKFGFSKIAFTLRTSVSASDNKWSALLYENNKCYYSKEYLIHIADRVGGGDSFDAGLIYALLEKFSPQEAVEFAAAAGCFKHSIEGDFNIATLEEIKKLAGGDCTGRVQR